MFIFSAKAEQIIITYIETRCYRRILIYARIKHYTLMLDKLVKIIDDVVIIAIELYFIVVVQEKQHLNMTLVRGNS